MRALDTGRQAQVQNDDVEDLDLLGAGKRVLPSTTRPGPRYDVFPIWDQLDSSIFSSTDIPYEGDAENSTEGFQQPPEFDVEEVSTTT